MRTRATAVVFSALLVAFCGVLACAGQRAREDVVVPAIRLAWPLVKEDADRGAHLVTGAPVAIQNMHAAVEAGGPAALIAAPWPLVKQAASLGIDERARTGALGPQVAESLRERVRRFDAAVVKLAEVPQ